jgi:RNA polymerase sigma-70 factor (ECF subfamily)
VAVKAGLTNQEAEEVVQETVITVSRRIPEFIYVPEVCSFKTWLMNMTRWRIIDQIRKRKTDAARPGSGRRGEATSTRTPTVERVPDPASFDLDGNWEHEWEQHLLEAATAMVKKRVKPEQYQMFALCVFKEWPVAKVAKKLNASLSRVYLAKHRVGVILRKEVARVKREHELAVWVRSLGRRD